MVPPAAIEVSGVTDTQGITLPEPTSLPLRINDLYNRNAKANTNKGSWGVAAACTSAQFRFPSTSTTRPAPKARRWDHLLSPEAASRKGSSLKGAARFLATPGLISLGGGLPSSAYFPFAQLTAHVPVSPAFSEQQTLATGKTLVAGKHDLATGQSIFDISTAFNYGQGTGSAQMLRWVTEHTQLVHRPPYADWARNLTIGSTSAFDMAMRMFTVRGDYILTEEYTYPAAIETTAPMGVKMVGLPMDAQGMLPDALDETLNRWNPMDRGGAKKPRVLYTVPTGQNPTGATMSAKRRRAIYDICQRHDVYILEDEPYFFLQLPEYDASGREETVRLPLSRDAFLASLIPSFLSIDTDGRVLRMDSFSKMISPGLRAGWITASEQIVERYKMHADASTHGPSGLSQLVLFKLLDEHWGHAGYLDWLAYVRDEYRARRDAIVRACERHLPRGVVSWDAPRAGMFHWMRINWHAHPLATSGDVGSGTASCVEAIEERIFLRSIEHGALVMRGSWFAAEQHAHGGARNGAPANLFFRATFGAAPFEQIDEAIRRFGAALREEFGSGGEEDGVVNGGGGGGGWGVGV